MNRHYVNIDWNFDPLIDMDLTRFQKRHTVIDTEDINPAFLEKLISSGLKLVLAECFYSCSGFHGKAHVDGIACSGNVWESRCKINWVNAPTALTLWYDILPENRSNTRISATAIETNFINYDAVPKVIIEDAYLSCWHLFEAGFPHKVINKSSCQRWCLSFVTCPIEEPNGWATMELISERLEIYCPESAAGEAILLTSGKM